MSEDNYHLQLNCCHRTTILVLIVTQYALFLVSMVVFLNYFLFALSFLPYPSMITTPNLTPHYLTNILLYLLFWVQHIIMATLRYKLTWLACWKYFPLYDRYLYNIASGVCLWAMCAYARPSFHLIFVIPLWVCIPFLLVAVFVLIAGSCALGSIMSPITLDKILNQDEIELIPYDTQRHTELVSTGIYGYIRHPLQTGVLLLIIFGSGLYTIQRMIFVGVNIIFVFIGVLFQEQRLCDLQKEYPEYMEKVKSRFIPFLI